MRFQVPQFIEVEDKIFGPLTLKQFIYLAGGGGLSFLIYVLIGNLALAFIPMVIVMAVSAAFSFYRVNNRSFVSIAESAFRYFFGKKLFIWKKEDRVMPATPQEGLKDAKSYASVMVPKISNSKLKDLSWSLDIKESVYSNKNQR